jgi:hypothetical protein
MYPSTLNPIQKKIDLVLTWCPKTTTLFMSFDQQEQTSLRFPGQPPFENNITSETFLARR